MTKYELKRVKNEVDTEAEANDDVYSEHKGI